MRTILLILGCIGVSGCTAGHPDAKLYPGFFGQNVRGNEVSVTVSNVWNQVDALPLADKHCRQFDRAARFNRMDGAIASFDCIRVD